jgi:hypothetical protein
MQQSFFQIIAALLSLFLGRRLFWLFVGILGFLAGITFAAQVFSHQPQWVLLLISLGCGLIGIFLAIFLQRLAVVVAGFLAGGLFAASFVQSIGWNLAQPFPFLVGGLIGAILFSLLFDWALIFFSSMIGAMLIARALPVNPSVATAAFASLFLLGIFVQAKFLPPASIQRKEET